MEPNVGKPGGGVRSIACVALFLITTFATGPPAAQAALTILGGQLYYTGGDVTVDVIHSSTAFTEILQLRSASTIFDIAYNYEADARVTLTEEQFASWGIAAGDELLFGIHVLNTDNVFLMGPGSRNGDGIEHAYLRESGRGYYFVGLEDLWGGGDRDYNDTIFRFSGGIAPAEPNAIIAEPPTLLLFLTGMALTAWLRRRRRA